MTEGAPDRRAWAALAWAGALWAAARVPVLVDALPFLGVAAGPLGSVLLLVAGCVLLARPAAAFWRIATPRLPTRLREPGPILLALALGAVFVPAGLYYTSRLGVSGDEPHYLLMAQSLWRDGDLDLRNNVAAGDWAEYTPRAFEPHYGAPRYDGRPFPAHSAGLPALLAPAYAVGGRTGCVVLMGLVAVAVALLGRLLAMRLVGDRRAASLAFVAVAGPPLVYYSFHLYTETPAALVLWSGFALLTGGASTVCAALAALCASALPWLHLKMLVAAVALGGIALVRLRGRPLVAFVAVAGAMAALFLAYNGAIYGRASPLAPYGGVPTDYSGSALRAVAGLLVDRSFGLLPHAPVALLALSGLGILATRREAIPHLVIGLAVLGPVLSWRMWWGGQCPPGRFLVPLVPLLVVAVTAAVSAPSRGLVRWRHALVGLSLAMAVYAIHDPGARLLLNRANQPTRVWAALSGPVPVGRYLPSLTRPDPFEDRVALVWIAALVVLFSVDLLARRMDRVDRWFRGLALPLVLLIGVGVGVDFWARRGQPAPEDSAPKRAGLLSAGESRAHADARAPLAALR